MTQSVMNIEKKPYQSPTLREYGTLAELTLASAMGPQLDNDPDPNGNPQRTG
jgi:hypothetical protein